METEAADGNRPFFFCPYSFERNFITLGKPRSDERNEKFIGIEPVGRFSDPLCGGFFNNW